MVTQERDGSGKVREDTFSVATVCWHDLTSHNTLEEALKESKTLGTIVVLVLDKGETIHDE